MKISSKSFSASRSRRDIEDEIESNNNDNVQTISGKSFSYFFRFYLTKEINENWRL